MDLKTLSKTTWDKIKVGEIFAYEGCWTIFEKYSETHARLIDSDHESEYPRSGPQQ